MPPVRLASTTSHGPTSASSDRGKSPTTTPHSRHLVERRALPRRFDRVGIGIDRGHCASAAQRCRHREHARARAQVEHSSAVHVDVPQRAGTTASRHDGPSRTHARGSMITSVEPAGTGECRPRRRHNKRSGADGRDLALRTRRPVIVRDFFASYFESVLRIPSASAARSSAAEEKKMRQWSRDPLPQLVAPTSDPQASWRQRRVGQILDLRSANRRSPPIRRSASGTGPMRVARTVSAGQSLRSPRCL